MGKKKIFYLDPDERKWTMEDLGLSSDGSIKENDEQEKIGGTYLATNGRVVSLSELPNHCNICLDLIAYNDEYDSIYCVTCNEWRDMACGDPTCDYCADRPEKPSDCI